MLPNSTSTTTASGSLGNHRPVEEEDNQQSIPSVGDVVRRKRSDENQEEIDHDQTEPNLPPDYVSSDLFDFPEDGYSLYNDDADFDSRYYDFADNCAEDQAKDFDDDDNYDSSQSEDVLSDSSNSESDEDEYLDDDDDSGPSSGGDDSGSSSDDDDEGSSMSDDGDAGSSSGDDDEDGNLCGNPQMEMVTFNENSMVELEIQKTCSICTDDFVVNDDEICQLECRHRFHMPCLQPWTSRRWTCPLCRLPLGPAQECNIN